MIGIDAPRPRDELQGRALLGMAAVTPHLAHVRAQGSSSRSRTSTGSISKKPATAITGRAGWGRT